MHSHPSPGWQGMSGPDVEAERDVLAYPAGATGLPLVGLTIGTDGFWSARFWEKCGLRMDRHWCQKTRVIGRRTYAVHYNDSMMPPPPRKQALKRTFDTWGPKAQDVIARLKVGVVGLGSVGCIVAESMARIGVTQIVLIDPDRVEEHNLDRLLFGTRSDIGKLKVDLATRAIRRHATAHRPQITALATSIHNRSAYLSALDCDIIFSCVDRPVARDVLNYIANSHLIPVVDGGVAIEFDAREDRLSSAHWRAYLVTPFHQCLRCSRQYDSSMVVTELDGSMDDPSYVSNLPVQLRIANQNVFPFSLSAAAMEVNLALRYLIAANWWPIVAQQDCQFVAGSTRILEGECRPHCEFRRRRAQGDAQDPVYLTVDERREGRLSSLIALWRRVVKGVGRVIERRIR